MAATDKSLLAEPTGSSHLKKLVIDAPSTSDQPKVIDVDAPPPPPEDDLEVEEVEPQLSRFDDGRRAYRTRPKGQQKQPRRKNA